MQVSDLDYTAARDERAGKSGMTQWKRYQEETAKLFRELGCEVETDFKVDGARASHVLDVWVRFRRFGLQQLWIVECKLWNRRVPKEKVLALRSIVEDVGADRGVLIAEAGYQSGAYAATKLTNITLTSLARLREEAKDELLSLGLAEVRRRAATIKQDTFSSLYDSVHEEKGGVTMGRSSPKPGVDGRVVMKIGGSVAIIDMGAEQAQLGAFPVPLRFDDDGNKIIRATDLEEFVTVASDILSSLDLLLVEQKRKVI